MNEDLLRKLSEADSIASNESEVREIAYQELKDCCDEVIYDPLGSMIFYKKGKSTQPVKMMFSAHMDEVGFMVRHISDIGFLYLMAVGGVLDKSKEMQIVRVTTDDGRKYEGLLNVTKDNQGKIKDMYVDIGCDSAEEVLSLGIEVGNIVCFASSLRKVQPKVYMGKAMDDRSGCYVLIETMKQIKDSDNDLYFVLSSSEEVGIRGSKTATHLIKPDVFFAVDVANNPELVKNYTNHRLLGHGPMIEHYDKTLVPNRKLVKYVKKIADENCIPYQDDMLSGGGTDAGNAHLEAGGCLAMVLGIPLRYCHGSYSMVHSDDLENLIRLTVESSKINRMDYKTIINFWEENKND